MQNALEITSISQFWIRNVQNRTKSRKYAPIWADMGPARALEESVGPARALEEQEKFKKNALAYALLRKHVAFVLQATIFDGFNVLLSFLAET